MAIQVDIPPDLTHEEKAAAIQYLDASLNSQILYALLHGIYTGIFAATLWNMFIRKFWPIRRRVLVIFITLLYALITVNFAVLWKYTRSAFIDNRQSFWSALLKDISLNQAVILEAGIAASLSTILADLYIIWCCWMVWERRWLIVLLPILSLISATVSKIIEVYIEYSTSLDRIIHTTLYISSVLATTTWCTLFIIIRILIVTGLRHGAGGRLKVFHRFIQVLVESSAPYSITLILYLAFFVRSGFGHFYFDVIASIAKGVAPTLLVGRAAAGHTRPAEENDENVFAILSTFAVFHFKFPGIHHAERSP
ncbi:hypothetical protein F5146DRAFT_1005753 [Armillaria mellea]|nr:hypothetical protein F5146DRAFT_1005753 [Armillaria mellea]